MTRINLVPVEELSDQHLMAEYRELPRIVNGVLEGRLKPLNIPEHYVLGAGHVKFFTNKIGFLTVRYKQIFDELIYRGFRLKFSPDEMMKKVENSGCTFEDVYIFSKEEIALSRQRIIEKIIKKPMWYKWTKRDEPDYSCNIKKGELNVY